LILLEGFLVIRWIFGQCGTQQGYIIGAASVR
jgi:hypothetical protein